MIKKILKQISQNKREKIKDSLTVEEIKTIAQRLGYTLQKIEKRTIKKRTPKQRVEIAQKKMIQNGEKITILGISRVAKVSRTTARKYLSLKNKPQTPQNRALKQKEDTNPKSNSATKLLTHQKKQKFFLDKNNNDTNSIKPLPQHTLSPITKTNNTLKS